MYFHITIMDVILNGKKTWHGIPIIQLNYVTDTMQRNMIQVLMGQKDRINSEGKVRGSEGSHQLKLIQEA